jgi:hypothetical protein
MPLVFFDHLPDHARLWVFAADRPLSAEEKRLVAGSVETGLAAWSAHGSPVQWGYQLVHDQFLMIGVDETVTELSGCSIDSAVHQLKALEDRLGLSLLDNSPVFYREGGRVRRVSRPEFRDLARSGAVTEDTVVFNNVLATVGELRRGGWEIPLRRSWHAEAFPVVRS